MVDSMKKFVKRASNAILFGSQPHNPHAHHLSFPAHHPHLHPISANASPRTRQRSLSAVASMPDLRHLSLSPRATRLAHTIPSSRAVAGATGGDGHAHTSSASFPFDPSVTPTPTIGEEGKGSLFEGRTAANSETHHHHTSSSVSPPSHLVLSTSAPGSRNATPPGSDDESEVVNSCLHLASDLSPSDFSSIHILLFV
jgi:hypothetical protein